MHLMIVWAAVYLTWGLGLRPTWRGYGSTVAITLVWLVSVFAFNELAGTNYGYVNASRAPPRSSTTWVRGRGTSPSRSPSSPSSGRS